MTQTKFITLALAFVVSSVMVIAPALSPVYAQPRSNDPAQDGLSDIGVAFPNGAQQQNRTIRDIAKMVIDWALYLAAIIAVIFIIIGGFLYITSAGDPGKATKGRSTLTNALIGLTIIILSYLIVQIVYNFLVNR